MPAGVVVFFLAAIAAFGLFQWRTLSQSVNTDTVEVAHIDNEFDLYKVFIRYAVDYMNANPTASGTFYWSSIATALQLPPALANTGMPSTWRIVSDGTTYVLCTDMRNDETPARIGRLLADRPEQVNRVSGKWVVGDPATPSVLTTEAAKCS